jgi:hypothetical protein
MEAASARLRSAKRVRLLRITCIIFADVLEAGVEKDFIRMFNE